MTQIQINQHKTLRSIAEEFQQHFPNLQLRFFAEPHGVGEASDLWETLNQDLPLGSLSSLASEASLSIHGNLKVSSFEQAFQEKFGLGVQVMKQVSGKWVQTLSSDVFSIGALNRLSEIRSL